MRLFLILSVMSCLYGSTQAQDIHYAKKTVKTLTSDVFKGRGYVGQGDLMAAEYITQQFDSLGLTPLVKNYTQAFDISVNTFPKDMLLMINDITLKPGEDYLIDPGSPSIKGTFEVKTLTIEDMLDSVKLDRQLDLAQGKILVIKNYTLDSYSKKQKSDITKITNTLKNNSNSQIAGIINLTSNKLTWSVSSKQQSKPVFNVSISDMNLTKITVNAKAKMLKNYTSQNIVGYLPGERSDSTVVYTAHYDHLGMMGSKTIFPGANDNASGIAMLLNLAKHCSTETPKFNTAFIAFGAEEIGLVGSRFFVNNPLFDLATIKFLVNFDISGTGDEGIQVVNGKIYRKEFDLLSQINEEKQYLKQVKIRGEACNSDHCFFHLQGTPSFFIYTLGGIQAYHDIYDRYETLPLTKFEDYFRLIRDFTDQL